MIHLVVTCEEAEQSRRIGEQLDTSLDVDMTSVATWTLSAERLTHSASAYALKISLPLLQNSNTRPAIT